MILEVTIDSNNKDKFSLFEEFMDSEHVLECKHKVFL